MQEFAMNMVAVEVSTDAATALWLARRGTESPSQTILRLSSFSTRTASVRAKSLRQRLPANSGKVRCEVLGHAFHSRTAKKAYLATLTILADLEPTLLERLAEKSGGTSRNHFSRERQNVYPGRPDFDESIEVLPNGWFVGTNISNSEKRKFLRIACEMLGLEFGKEVMFGA
jgi:hypothetical protein